MRSALYFLSAGYFLSHFSTKVMNCSYSCKELREFGIRKKNLTHFYRTVPLTRNFQPLDNAHGGQTKKEPHGFLHGALTQRRQLPTLPHCIAVPSAMTGLTSLFGMGRGGTPSLSPPKISFLLLTARQDEYNADILIQAKPTLLKP